MDVIWTAEFAEAGWIREWTGADKDDVSARDAGGPAAQRHLPGQALRGPVHVERAVPLVPQGPRPGAAQDLGRDDRDGRAAREDGKNGTIEIQGAQYEGLTVWFNTLIASAGGQVVDDQGNVLIGVGGSSRLRSKAAGVIQKLATSRRRRPEPVELDGGHDAARRSRPAGRRSCSTGRTSTRARRPRVPDIFENMGVARYPAVDASEPSHVTLGGINLGVSTYSPLSRSRRWTPTKCLRRRAQPDHRRGEGRPAADHRGALRRRSRSRRRIRTSPT